MMKTELETTADNVWQMIPTQSSFVQLEEWMVMPSHLHGIITIDCRDAINRVSTMDDAVDTVGAISNKNPMLHQNLSTIIRWFKRRATFEARKIHADFAWQPRFHDHIIRDAEHHEKIQYYILNNPLLWDKDKFNPKNFPVACVYLCPT